MIADALEHIIAIFIAGLLALGTLFSGGLATTSDPSNKAAVNPASETPVEVSGRSSEALATQLASGQVVDELVPVEDISQTVSPTLPPLPPKVPLSVINESMRAATVNILCTVKSRRITQVITGSGVLVDPRGVILTNAHVAQFFLLIDNHPKGDVDCTIRTGSPDTERYEAKLLYLPPAWIEKNAQDIDNQDARGTGEDDYAFLLITQSVDRNMEMPSSFPWVTINTDQGTVRSGDVVLLASYPVQTSVNDVDALSSLSVGSTIAIIEGLFTLEQRTLDVFSLGDTSLSYKGSSGGAVVDEYNRLTGIITTSTEGETEKDRELRAITLSHIDRSITKYTGFDIDFWLFGDLNLKASLYNNGTAPALTERLVRALED